MFGDSVIESRAEPLRGPSPFEPKTQAFEIGPETGNEHELP